VRTGAGQENDAKIRGATDSGAPLKAALVRLPDDDRDDSRRWSRIPRLRCAGFHVNQEIILSKVLDIPFCQKTGNRIDC
jgi:hypothetical protein